MVNIMVRPATRQPTGVWHDCDEAGALDAIATGGDLSTALGGEQLPMDPSTCIFWCAVALGALVKGCPVESVRSSDVFPHFPYINQGRCFRKKYSENVFLSSPRMARLLIPIANHQHQSELLQNPTEDQLLTSSNALEFVLKGGGLLPTGNRCAGNPFGSSKHGGGEVSMRN